MRTVLILGGGLTQCDAIASARRLGLRVVVADGDAEAPGMRLADPAVIPLPISFTDLEALLAELERRGLEVDAVLPYGSDQSVLPASRLARRLGVAGLSEEAARACTDKIEMRRRWERAGVPTLPWAEATEAAAAEAEALKLGLPVVVKPPDNAAQRGVQLVTERSKLRPAVEEALSQSPSRRVLIERALEGPELAVTTFAIAGETRTIQITDRVTGPPPYLGICLAHIAPSELDGQELVRVAELVPKAAEALGVTDGPTYSQLRVSSDGEPYLFETGARLGGGRDCELRALLSGQDAIAVQLRLLLGEGPSLDELDPGGLSGGGCVRFLTAAARGGVLRAVQGRARALARPGVQSLALFFEVGRRVPPLESGAARVGYLIATGEGRSQAVERAEAAAAELTFELR